MAKIIKKSTYEEFEFKGKLQFRLLNPVFYDKNSFTFEANLPSTYTNDKLLGFFRQPEIAALSIEEPVIVESAIDSYEGIMYVNRFDGKNYVFNIIITNNTERIKEKLLTDLDKTYDFSGMSQEDICDLIYTSLDGEMDYVCCEALAKDLYKELPFNALGRTFDNPSVGIDTALNFGTNNITFYAAHNKNNAALVGIDVLITPFFYFHAIIREIFNFMGLLNNKNIFKTDPDLNKLCLFNTMAINKIDIDPTGNGDKTQYSVSTIISEYAPHVTCNLYDGPHTKYVYIRNIDNPTGSDWANLHSNYYLIDFWEPGGSFRLNGVDTTGYTAFNNLVNIFTAEFIQSIDGNVFEDEKNTIVTHNEQTWKTGDYIFIYPYGLAEGNSLFVRVERVDSTHFVLLGLKTELFGGQTPSIAIVNQCSFTSVLQSIKLKYHLPSVSIGNFIKNIEIHFWCKFFYNKGVCDIMFLKDLLTADIIMVDGIFEKPVTDEQPKITGYKIGITTDTEDAEISNNVSDISDEHQLKTSVDVYENLPAINNENNDIRLVENRNALYLFSRYIKGDVISLTPDTIWQFFSMNINGRIIGDGNEDAVSEFCPVLWNMDMSKQGDINIYFDRPVSCYNYRDLNKNNALRMFFYRGKSYSPVWFSNRPIATGGIYNHQHDVIGALALEYSSAHGIYEKYAKNWIAWNMLFRKDFVAKIQWPISILKNFDFTKRYNINGINYLVKSIEFEDFNGVITFGNTELARC